MPTNWLEFKAWMQDRGASDEVLSAARLGYEVGRFSALYQVGADRIPGDDYGLLRNWGQQYPQVFESASAALQEFEEGGGS